MIFRIRGGVDCEEERCVIDIYIYIVVTDPFPVTGKVELNRDLLHKIVVILNIHWVLGSGLHTQVIQFSYVTHYTP